MTDELMHSRTKGSKNKRHKYTAIVNGRYIYDSNGNRFTDPGEAMEYNKGKAKNAQHKKNNQYRGAANEESTKNAQAISKNRQRNLKKQRLKKEKANRDPMVKTYNELKTKTIANKARKKGISTYRGAASKTGGENARRISEIKLEQDREKRRKKRVGKNRSAYNTNSEKLLAAQRAKQRKTGDNIKARAKKLARALKRTFTTSPKNHLKKALSSLIGKTKFSKYNRLNAAAKKKR